MKEVTFKPIPQPDDKQLKQLLELSNKAFPVFRNEIHEFYGDDGELFIGCNNVINIGAEVPMIKAWTIHWLEWLSHLSDQLQLDQDHTHLWFWQQTHPVDHLLMCYEEDSDEEE